MKQLTPDEITARLIACAEKSLELQGDDEPLYLCHQCLDTKFLCHTEQITGHPGPSIHSKPCHYCTAGQDLLESRMRAETRHEHRDHSGELKRFRPLFQRMCLQFGKSPSPALLDAYWAELQDFTPEELERGVKHASRRCRYMPKIREIIDGIEGAPI